MTPVLVYWSSPYWRVSYGGTIMLLCDDRKEAEQAGRVIGEYYGLQVIVQRKSPQE